VITLNGLGVSPGIASGRAFVVRPGRRQVFYLVPVARVELEVRRLAEAQARTQAQLEDIRTTVARLAGGGPASLFEAQLLMLADPTLAERAAGLIREHRYNAEWALERAAGEILAVLDEVHDPYLRERHGDVRDVVGRVIENLRGEVRGVVLPESPEPWLLVADELTPSTAAQVNWQQAAGFVTEVGSWTSHTAILARSLGIPAVAGVPGATTHIGPGADLLIDGGTGEVLVDAPDPAREQVLRRVTATAAPPSWPVPAGPAVTADGHAVRLDANLERPDDFEDAARSGADGIGLFRSEFLLAPDGMAPDEARQRQIYADLLAREAGEVTIRTFDQKLEHPTDGDPAIRPHLGLRALEVNAPFRDAFVVQIRALLASARAGRLRILLPFVTSVDDLKHARRLIAQSADDLRAVGMEVPPVPVGAMVEVPSAALTADALTHEADFLSVGTNDLIALTLALDRNDQRSSRFYDPLHPSILRLLRFVQQAGRRAGRRVAVCGEMAADPRGLAILLGLGFREFSMAPASLAMARRLVTTLAVRDLRALARATIHRESGYDARLDALVQPALDSRIAR
jgi:phosphotransferase system enzyme I (PtsI)